MILKKNLRLEIKNSLDIEGNEFLCDWSLYKLIVFNLL